MRRTRKLAKLVEKQRSMVRSLEETDRTSRRIGKRTAFVAEEKTLHETMRERTAVDGDEWQTRTPREIVKSPRDELLAPARFAEKQHRHVMPRDGWQGLEHPTHGFTTRDNVACRRLRRQLSEADVSSPRYVAYPSCDNDVLPARRQHLLQNCALRIRGPSNERNRSFGNANTARSDQPVRDDDPSLSRVTTRELIHERDHQVQHRPITTKYRWLGNDISVS